MSKFEKLLSVLSKYEDFTSEALLKGGKETKKLDPSAGVRNRGDVCVPASSAKDHKDHFPINDADQARNALSQVGKYTSAPSWYSGSLEGLKALISRKVHAKYPSIKSEKKKSASLNDLLKSYAEETDQLLANTELPIEERPEALLPQQAPAPFVATPKGQAQAPVVKRPATTYVPPPDYTGGDTYAPPPDYKPEVEDIDDYEDEIDAPTKANLRVSSRLMNKYSQNPNPQNLANMEQSVFPEPKVNYVDVGPTPTTPNLFKNDPHQELTYHPAKPVSNPNLVKVQTALKQIGLAGSDGKPLTIDGIMGPNTRFALQSFKRQYGMDNTTDQIAMSYLLNPQKLKENGFTPRQLGMPRPATWHKQVKH